MHARKILLVNPPFFRLYKPTYSLSGYPLSLGYLASAIKDETDWDVMLYNADFAAKSEPWIPSDFCGAGFENYRRNLFDSSNQVWEEVGTTMARYQPGVVGIYCCAPTFASAEMTARLAKKTSSRTIVVAGGPHPTAVGSEVLENPSIDIVVRGEGERTVVALLNAIASGGSLACVQGIIFRSGGGTVQNDDRKFTDNLDSLGPPHAYVHKVLKDYGKYPKTAFGRLITARGCPYDCFFCGSRSVWGRTVRYRSVQNVVDEIKSLRKMGVKWIDFVDDTFTVNNKYVRELCNSLVQECAGVHWTCETRADLIDEETVALMKRAGCRRIALGMESGNNGILNHMRKRVTVEQGIRAADIVRKHGIRVRANFLVGTPWETEATLSDTFSTMKDVKGELMYSIFTPYPGTEAFEYCQSRQLIDGNYDSSLYNHQSQENCFCINIEKERFRQLASEIEDYVERRNTQERLRTYFSPDGYHLIRVALSGLQSFGNMVRASKTVLAWLHRSHATPKQKTS